MGQEDFQELTSFLKRFIRRFKWIRGMEGLCITLVCGLLLFAAGPGIAYLKTLFPYAPLVYAAASGALLIFLLGRTVARLFVRLSVETAALYIETRRPALRNNLINSLQLYPQLSNARQPPGFSPSMVLALLRATRRQVSGLRLEDLVESRGLKGQLRLLALVFVPVLLMVLLHPSSVGETFSLLRHPLSHLPPSRTEIEIRPRGVRLARGSPLVIEARASGAVPESMQLVVRRRPSKPGEAADERPLPMEALGEGRFSTRIARLEHTLDYRAVSGSFSSPVYTANAVDPPEVGNVRATVYPPAYTGLGSTVFESGNVEGIKGSSLRIRASTTKPVIKAEIATQDGKRLPLKIDGKTLEGHWVLFHSQTYRILVEDEHGFRNSPISYEIRVKPDGFPSIELLSPSEDVEVAGDEVLTLEYSARDDFGLGRIELVAQVGARAERLRLQSEPGKRVILRDQFRWDLSRLGMREGEEAVFHLEVLDNDTISGPKLGASRSLRLRLKNLRQEHRRVADAIADLNSRMVDLLADHLESPQSGPDAPERAREAQQKLERGLTEVLKHTEQALARTEKDRLSDFATWSDLSALKKNLEFTRDQLLPRQAQAENQPDRLKARDEISSELERMSLLSEDIAKRMKAQELAANARDLARSQERLLDALEKLQSGDKNIRAILDQLSEMGKLLSSLQQALSQLAQQAPDDFVNADAMRGLGFDQMFSALGEIRKKLMQGDLEGARQLARELFNQMASMVASLQNAQRSAMSSAMGRMQGEMGRSSNELQQIAREQQEILLGTEKVNKSALSERDATLREKLERFLGQAKEDLGRLTELFPDREGGDTVESRLDDATVNHLVKNLISRLLARDFPGYLEGDRLARDELAKERDPAQEEKAQTAERTLDRIKKDLQTLMGTAMRPLSEAEKKELRDLTLRQGTLRDRARGLHEKLQSLFQLFPSLDPAILQNIEEAGGSMSAARDRLAGLDARNALPPERDALDRLTQSQQQMQSAMQQLAQRGQLGNVPVTMVFRRGRFLPYGSLTPLPGVPEFPEFNVEGGVTGLETERFRLPGKEDYRAPRNFREEILESLKQGIPQQHRDQIERYFKNLTE